MPITSFPESSENLKVTSIAMPEAVNREVARTAIRGDEKPREEVFGLYNGLINLPDEDISSMVDNMWQKLEHGRKLPRVVDTYFKDFLEELMILI